MPGAKLLLNTIALDPNRWTLHKQPYVRLVDVLPDLARAGFYELEVWQYHLSRLERAEVRALKQRAADLGVSMPIIGLYPILHATGEELVREREHVGALLEAAAFLEAWGVKMFAGRLGSVDVAADAYARSVAFARAIAARAAEHGLTLTAETHPDTLCDSVAACRRFLRDVAAPNLHLCFQPFDFADTARAVAGYEALHKHVVHVHMQGRTNDQICRLEDADIDYRKLLAAFAAGGFDGYCCIEFVEGSIVEDPAAFDLERVLANAQRDHAFLEAVATEAGLALLGRD